MTREMTKEKAIECNKNLRMYMELSDKNKPYKFLEENYIALDMAIKALEQEPCEDCISRQAVLNLTKELRFDSVEGMKDYCYRCIDPHDVEDLPSIQPKKVGHCKDCKFFEYDSVAKINGMRLIVAHEICSKWGDGCKTSEDGYCFLFEPNCEAKMEETDGN